MVNGYIFFIYILSGPFEASNTQFKSKFRFTNKQKSDVQRQLMLHTSRHYALHLLRTPSSADKKKRESRFPEPLKVRPSKKIESQLDPLTIATYVNDCN